MIPATRSTCLSAAVHGVQTTQKIQVAIRLHAFTHVRIQPPDAGVFNGRIPGEADGHMVLADVAIRHAKPGEKAIKLADGAGMFLLVTPAGGKLWRLKYRIDRREKQDDKTCSRIQAADTFGTIAHEYCAKRKRDGEKGWSPATATRSRISAALAQSRHWETEDCRNRACRRADGSAQDRS